MKKKKIILQILFLSCFFYTSALFASTGEHLNSDRFAVWRTYPFYIGVELGWGNTDWSKLVARGNFDEVSTLSLSAPIAAGDHGFVYGFMMGYEISTYFAMETNYMRFPNTVIIFAPFSQYDVNDPNQIKMNSSSYAFNVVGKFMVPIGSSDWRGFANAGAALTHRNDAFAVVSHIVPTFGVGVNYAFHLRYFIEIAFQYYAGYGEATITPALDYIPFFYTVHTKLGVRFNS